MRAYFERLHKEVRPAPEGKGGHLWIFGFPSFSREFPGDARELFRQAEAAAGEVLWDRFYLDLGAHPLEPFGVGAPQRVGVGDERVPGLGVTGNLGDL